MMTTPTITPIIITPTSIDGLQLWIDATDPNCYTLSSGTNNITQLKDKSGKKNHTVKSLGNKNNTYESSSAHTDGELSESDRKLNHGVRLSNNFESSSSTQSSPDSSSVSTITDEKKDMMTTSISVNTDDINMVSEY